MGFFSFNSEILSLSDTIKTNRGRRGMLSNRDTGCSEPSPRAPGVGPAGSRRRGRRGPGRDLRGAPRGHPWTPGRFAKWWVRSPGKRPLLRGRASPRPSLRGLLRGASLVPPFWEVRRHLWPKRPFRPASFQCSPSRVPPGFPRASLRLPRGVGETKDQWKREARSPRGAPPTLSETWRGPRGGPAAGGARAPGNQCLTCGEAAEKEGEGRPESQG